MTQGKNGMHSVLNGGHVPNHLQERLLKEAILNESQNTNHMFNSKPSRDMQQAIYDVNHMQHQ